MLKLRRIKKRIWGVIGDALDAAQEPANRMDGERV